MARKPLTARGGRRAEERRTKKLRDDLEKLAHLEAGGSPEHPIEVSSPVQVDARTETTPCPLCEGRLQLDEHVAEVVGGERLRVARCHCVECGTARVIYYRLRSPLQS
ncbi:MAG: hypothetical protein P8R42_16615 [Candidatus Binatia bacterium]|nr:hypothetical protein [Candidatus Binatia bacterium]